MVTTSAMTKLNLYAGFCTQQKEQAFKRVSNTFDSIG